MYEIVWSGRGWYAFSYERATRLPDDAIREAQAAGMSVGDLARQRGEGTPFFLEERPVSDDQLVVTDDEFYELLVDVMKRAAGWEGI